MTKLLATGLLAAAACSGCADRAIAPAAVAPAPRAAAAVPAASAPAALSAGPAAPASPSRPARAADAAAGAPHYRCDNGTEFTVRFGDDSAIVDAGPRGREELPRDAGGATPEQTVYSNTRMRAEFGLGESGREALLRYAQPPQLAHCVRD